VRSRVFPGGIGDYGVHTLTIASTINGVVKEERVLFGGKPWVDEEPKEAPAGRKLLQKTISRKFKPPAPSSVERAIKKGERGFGHLHVSLP